MNRQQNLLQWKNLSPPACPLRSTKRLCSRTSSIHHLYNNIKSYVSNFYVGMVVEKNGRRYIAIQNVAKIISVVEALYAILTVCLG